MTLRLILSLLSSAGFGYLVYSAIQTRDASTAGLAAYTLLIALWFMTDKGTR